MATVALIPVEEYLHTSYHPDCDYVDGEVQERNLGELWHSSVQTMISLLFNQRRREWGLFAVVEQRLQVTPSRFRVSDVCLLRTDAPFTPIITTPPALCAEVLTPEDRFDRVIAKVGDYIAMGVPEVWIVDPRTRNIWTVAASGGPVSFLGPVLTLTGTPVEVNVAEIFALLDEPGEGLTSEASQG